MKVSLFAATIALTSLTIAPAIAQVALDDRNLDSVSGGEVIARYDDYPDSRPLPQPRSLNASGGVVAGEDSDVTRTLNSVVDLRNDAQSDIQGVNLTNSSESTVGNGTNIWSGKHAAGENGTPAFAINNQMGTDQANITSQNQARSASVGAFVVGDTGTNTTDSSSRTLSSNSSVDTEMQILGQSIKSGAGGAGSGSISAEVDAGEISFEPRFVTESAAGGSLIDIPVVGSLGNVEGEVSVTTEAPLTLDLPTLELNIDGSGCGVNMGSCEANGTDEQTESSSSTIAAAPRVALQNAQAEYILLGGGNLDTNTTSRIQLQDNAQRNAKGINIVNASTSVVGNGANIAFTNGLTASAGVQNIVRQTNVLVQQR